MKRFLPNLWLLLALLFSTALSAERSATEETPKEPIESEIPAFVADAYIELHTGPGRGYPVFYIAERDEKIFLLKQRTDWIKIRTHRGQEGWARLNDVAKTIDQYGQSMALNIPQLDEFNNRRWELGFMAGDFDGTDIVTGYAGYHFTRNLSVEVALSENFGNFSSGQSALISIVHQPFPNWRYSPFFTLGGGVRKTDPRSTLVETEDRNDDVLAVGAGIRVYLGKRLMLRAQYKKHTVLTNRDDDIEVDEWKIGLSAYF